MEKQDTFRAVVLIPAYKPDERLVQLTRELKEEKLDVLLVDDGGQQAFAHIFDECRALGAEVAVHAVNQGKGRALKTGLNAALNLWPDLSGVVTADADGQHTLRDILRLIEAMREHPNALVLGSREFTGDVPFKSRWGNRITRFVYALASGVHVSDTQTGLRGLPACAIPAMITIAVISAGPPTSINLLKLNSSPSDKSRKMMPISARSILKSAAVISLSRMFSTSSPT